MNVYVGNKLPSEYQEVEYIQTTGTQWIDTGLTVSSNIQIETSIEVTTTEQNLPVFGCHIPGDPVVKASNWCHLTCYNSIWYAGVNNNQINGGTYSPVVGTKYDIVYNNASAKLVINNSEIGSTSGASTYSGSTLAIGNRGKINYFIYSKFKYFYFKVFDKTTNKYTRNFVPCYRISDGVIGLYDLVNNQFYTNSGTGTFSKGNDVTMAVLQNAYIGNGLS